MPYNPNSAYPRQSTHTPSTYGAGPQRAINEVDWSGPHAAPQGGSRQAAINAMMARAGAADPGNIAPAMAASQRQGLVGQAAARVREAQGLKQNGGKGTTGPANAQPVRSMPTLTPAMASRGGRQHVAAVNDNLADFGTRQRAASGVEAAVESVLTGTPLGTRSMPKFSFGSSRV